MRVRVVCECENPICEFLLLNLAVTCAFYQDRTQLAENSQPPPPISIPFSDTSKSYRNGALQFFPFPKELFVYTQWALY